jgi:hypothetical protein
VDHTPGGNIIARKGRGMTERQAAMMMVRKFGQAAAARASEFAWNRRGEGDEAGYQMWMDVSLAIDELRNVAQPRAIA